MMMRRIGQIAIGCGLLLSQLRGFRSFAEDSGAMVDHEIRMLEFIGGGSPLTGPERKEAAAAVSMAMRTAPAKWREVDSVIQKDLEQIGQGNVVYNNGLREQLRYVYEFGDASDWPAEFAIEKRIVEVHDPVVAEDREHRRMVTEHMLGLLEQTAVWTAKSYQLPPPDQDFPARMRSQLRQQLAALDEPIADGLAHIERDAWYAPSFFNQLPEAKRARFFAGNKEKTFHNLSDKAAEQWQIAEAGAMIAGFAQKRTMAHMEGGGGMSGPDMLRSQERQMRALQGAAKSFSPSCNVTVGSYSDRAQAGCYP